MPSYKPLKTVEKTLLVLKELNKRPTSRVNDLKAATGIPASSLVRILETLVARGYVQHMSRMSGYCITENVLALSSGYHGLPEVFDEAREIANRFTKELLWPASIATFDINAMVVRYSTIPLSPLAHKHSTVNRRLDILTRAHGRAYLAFCSDPERRHIYDVLIRSGFHPGPTKRLEAQMLPILKKARMLGIAKRDPDTEPDTTSLAIPIWVGSQLVATFGTTFFKKGVRHQGAIIRALLDAGIRFREAHKCG